MLLLCLLRIGDGRAEAQISTSNHIFEIEILHDSDVLVHEQIEVIGAEAENRNRRFLLGGAPGAWWWGSHANRNFVSNRMIDTVYDRRQSRLISRQLFRQLAKEGDCKTCGGFFGVIDGKATCHYCGVSP